MSQQPFAVEIGLATQSDVGDTHYLRGIVDPSVPPGVPAPVSSQYNRDIDGNELDAEIWLKFGIADTDWKKPESTGGSIGAAEDGDYTDGLFTDFAPATPTGTAVDRFNEVLKSLAPPPAPVFDSISGTTQGATARLSFGPSNAITGYSNVDGLGSSGVRDLNELFTVSGNVKGVISGTTDVTGLLAAGIPAHADTAYPAQSFGDADKGSLVLKVNSAVVHAVDLGTFDQGSSLNANNSGFTLSPATPVRFPSGDDFDAFKYRTGSWHVDASDLRDGYNTIRVTHSTGIDSNSNYVDYVVDADIAVLSVSGGDLELPTMSGSRYLSGVQYHTGGDSVYSASISNIHRNCYSSSPSAIAFTTQRCSVASRPLGSITDESENEIIVDGVTISTSSRLLNASISVGVNALHPIKSNLSNADPQSQAGILLDATPASSTLLFDSFDDEDFRSIGVGEATVGDYDEQSDLLLGEWASTISLTAGPGYADGLLVYDGTLRYPTKGLDAGDFRNVADGNTNGPQFGPDSNPDYSAVTGNRTYYRVFGNNTGLTKANAKIRIQGSTTSFNPVSSGPSGNAVTVEVKFPDGSITTGTGWLDAYGDFATNQWADGDGARNATEGPGRALNADWGLTIGTKSIASNEEIVIRITAADTWAGSLSSITLTWL